MSKIKNEKKVVAEVVTKKVEWVNLFKTTYYYWRYFIKAILIEGKIKKYRFVKDEIGYTGKIAVQKNEAINAKKVLGNYKSKHANELDMWS